MKKSKYPRLRKHVRKGKSGQVWVWYTYDMRPDGGTEISLGKDYAKALEEWHKLYHHLPRTKGLIQEAIDRWRKECLPLYRGTTLEGYTRQLKRVEDAFGKAAWHDITVPALRAYLDKRSAKTQGNRELAILSILWGKAIIWGMTQLPWPAANVKGWKNEENARTFEVTDRLFDAVYEKADRVLRDCMDIATATGMRLTDARTTALPVDGRLRFRAGKTSKAAYFEVAESPVLSALVERRLAMQVPATTLLVDDRGQPISARGLRTRYEKARDAAAEKAETELHDPSLARNIRSMFLRDMRKRAASLAGDDQAAAELLQHSNPAVTKKHYSAGGRKLKAVR